MNKNRNKNLTETETKAVGELIGGLKKLYGENLSKVILYGSKARGDSRKDSDIDVMVVLRDMTMSLKEIKKIDEISVPISLKYNLFISEFPVRESNLRPLNRTLFMENALNESLNLYER
ncbi:MAG: nucleotidyltransferase domain-containing protein [Nitrospirota bacterium]|nr:nucleotidyltransferase domain-containing protein [Nitrospirota bacterium]